jgi:hypothetical protein
MTVPFDAHAVVQFGGRRFDSWTDGQFFESLDLELATGESSEAEWRVFDPDPEFAFINSITKADGVDEVDMKAWLGFGEAVTDQRPLFEGILARVERDYGTTVCRAYDYGFRMRKLQKTEIHNGVTFLTLIEKLARRNGLKFKGPDEPPKLERHPVKQEAKTDWALAMEMAEQAGVVLYVRGMTLYAQGPAKTAADPLITLRFKEDFLLLDDFRMTFKVPENVEGRPAKVKVHGRGRGGRRLEGKSQVHPRGHERVQIKNDLHVRTARSAAGRATAQKELLRQHAFTGEVGVLPAYDGPRADVRDTVALVNLPVLFNGKYICDRVAHRFEPGGLMMQLSLYRDIAGAEDKAAKK